MCIHFTLFINLIFKRFRFPDHKDPEYTPSKLFRVERIKPAKGFPYWQKDILRELHILDVSQNFA